MSQQQGQIPINPMVPPQNPIPMQVPMHMHMNMNMNMPIPNMNMNMPMPMPLPMHMQMQMHHMPLHHHQLPLQVSYDPAAVTAGAPASGGKRRREDEAPGTAVSAEQSAAKRARGQDVIFRIVVPSRQIGKVIGKEGFRIQKIREETRATIKIADAIAVSAR